MPQDPGGDPIGLCCMVPSPGSWQWADLVIPSVRAHRRQGCMSETAPLGSGVLARLAQVLRHARITPPSRRQGARWLSPAPSGCLSRGISRKQGVLYLGDTLQVWDPQDP